MSKHMEVSETSPADDLTLSQGLRSLTAALLQKAVGVAALALVFVDVLYTLEQPALMAQ